MKILIILIIIFSISFSNQSQKVIVQFNWDYRFIFAGFIAAKEKGFYKEVGLDVEFKDYNPKEDIVKNVLDGKVTYGVSDSITILRSYLNGSSIKLIASFLKTPVISLITKPYISNIKDLDHKTIILFDKKEFIDNFKIFLKKNYVNINDIKLVPYANPSVENFINSKHDAITDFMFYNSHRLYISKIDYNKIDLFNYTLTELFTSKNELLKNPIKAIKFKLATVKGYKYALNNKKEIIDIIINKYNSSISHSLLEYESNTISDLTKKDDIGTISEDILSKQIKALKADAYISNILKDYIFDEKKYFYLTKEEIKYLKSKKTIKMCIYPNYMPFMDIKNNEFIGLISNAVKLVQKKLPTPIEVVKTKDFIQSIEKIKKRECDILPIIVKNEQYNFVNFTTPYIATPLVIATKNNILFIYDIRNILDKKIAVIKGYLSNILKNKYPNIKLVEVSSIKEGLNKVIKEKCYAFVDSLAAINYAIKNHYPNQLKISGMIQKDLYFSVATRKDEPILNYIFDKIILSLDENEKMKLFNKWVFEDQVQKMIDYSIVIKIIVIFIIIIFVISYFLYRLAKLQQQLYEFNKNLKKRIEKEIAKNREKEQQLILQSRLAQMGEIVSMIAHQWRQPLNIISTNINDLLMKIMLKNDIEKEYLKVKLQKIANTVQDTNEIIEDFRTFYKKDVKKTKVTLSEIIKKSFLIISPIIQEKKITLTIELNSKLKLKVKENELKQVILIIVKNAEDILLERKVKHPEITIKTYDKNNCSYIEIKDNGGGIDENIFDKIFDPYFTTKGKDGTGIGLNMAKNIIEKNHNGVLSVKNDKKGAIFTIKICEDDE